MSSKKPIDLTSTHMATDLIKEILRSPASTNFFGKYESESPALQDLISAHRALAEHFTKMGQEMEEGFIPIDDLPSF